MTYIGDDKVQDVGLANTAARRALARGKHCATSDVSIKVAALFNNVDDVTATVTLRYQKGKKNGPIQVVMLKGAPELCSLTWLLMHVPDHDHVSPDLSLTEILAASAGKPSLERLNDNFVFVKLINETQRRAGRMT